MVKHKSFPEAMITNTEYLAWGKSKYKKRFEMPGDLDRHRKKLGHKDRPVKYRV
jgi:hypothetical protein